MKKGICWLLCLVLLVGALPLSTAAKTPWYEGYAAYATRAGLMVGRAPGDFAGKGTLTRAEFATVLYRLAEEPSPSETEHAFPDVPAGKWYTDAVRWAAGAGVVTGFPDGTFRPQQAITREALAVMTARWILREKLSLSAVTDPVNDRLLEPFAPEEYADSHQISSWAAQGVETVSRLGLMAGSSTPGQPGRRVFSPGAFITRGECAAVVARLHAGILQAQAASEGEGLLAQAADPAPLSFSELLRQYPVSPAAQQALSRFAGNTASSLLAGKPDNGCYSPVSLYMALAMLTSGAAGETRRELLEALGQSETTLVPAAETLYRWHNQQEQGVTEKLANSLWLDANDQVRFDPDWVRRTSQDYHTDVFRADFLSGQAADLLSEWVAGHTGRLLRPAPEDLGFTPNTVLALVNTLWFKASWQEAYAAESIWDQPFVPEQGTPVEASFLHRTERDSRALQTETCTLADLPLVGGRMRFVLPREGQPLDRLLEPELLQRLLGASLDKRADVVWSIPQFATDQSYDLVETLQQLGVRKAFEEDAADFSPISQDPLWVGDVRQGTHFSLTDTGVEAAAYTVVDLDTKTAHPSEDLPVVEMTLDRPFLYIVYGRDSAPLFIGTVRSLQP